MSVTSKPQTRTLDDERIRPDSPDRATFLHHLARYQFAHAHLRAAGRILDAGCGTGYGTDLLSQKASFALGVDYSLLGIHYAIERFRRPHVQYAVMDCQRLALADAQFDAVISFEVFEHLEDPDLFVRECCRVLKPGGRLILSTPNGETNTLHMESIAQTFEFHINLMGKRELCRILRRYFAQVCLYGQRRRGSPLYTALRSLDVFNLRLRLRLFSPPRREQMQNALGVSNGQRAGAGQWIFSRWQLNQANNFVAVCDKAR